MPFEYWEYRLVDEHFRGDWLTYWNLDEGLIEMIMGFRNAEYEAAKLRKNRLERDYG